MKYFGKWIKEIKKHKEICEMHPIESSYLKKAQKIHLKIVYPKYQYVLKLTYINVLEFLCIHSWVLCYVDISAYFKILYIQL